ncbi:C40 family peptidase [Mucilaginibacter sp. CSA2-8R]|uniref:C40 family peptidase n=1 Tax=Mucilaginibacter sp. CSA2-8R TaxID=3141542 RepID=UPI00315D0294
MEYGISKIAIIPVRAEGSERSEMVSQLLFGETYAVTEQQEKWVKIITSFDAYEGWISRVQFTALSTDDYQKLQQEKPVLTTKALTTVTKQKDGSTLYLPAGCTLPFFADNSCKINSDVFTIADLDKTSSDLMVTAKSYLNSPYLWGGRTHFGIDCSGFAQTVYKQYGINLKRDASQQVEQGKVVDFLQGAKAGDLAFFDNEEGRIVHVGIMLNNEQIIHASGRVKIDTIDDQGIYSEEFRKHTHKLRIIKRMV